MKRLWPLAFLAILLLPFFSTPGAAQTNNVAVGRFTSNASAGFTVYGITGPTNCNLIFSGTTSAIDVQGDYNGSLSNITVTDASGGTHTQPFTPTANAQYFFGPVRYDYVQVAPDATFTGADMTGTLTCTGTPNVPTVQFTGISGIVGPSGPSGAPGAPGVDSLVASPPVSALIVTTSPTTYQISCPTCVNTTPSPVVSAPLAITSSWPYSITCAGCVNSTPSPVASGAVAISSSWPYIIAAPTPVPTPYAVGIGGTGTSSPAPIATTTACGAAGSVSGWPSTTVTFPLCTAPNHGTVSCTLLAGSCSVTATVTAGYKCTASYDEASSTTNLALLLPLSVAVSSTTLTVYMQGTGSGAAAADYVCH